MPAKFTSCFYEMQANFASDLGEKVSPYQARAALIPIAGTWIFGVVSMLFKLVTSYRAGAELCNYA